VIVEGVGMQCKVPIMDPFAYVMVREHRDHISILIQLMLAHASTPLLIYK
jgi:hypothetical protein